jgi:hypothetical protein
LMELDTGGRKHCRFICDDNLYCGAEQIAGRSRYCAEHHDICWVRVRVRRNSPISLPVDKVEPRVEAA